MVSKIEPILLVIIAIFAYIGFNIQEEGKILKQKYSKEKKDVQIDRASGVEVNATGLAYRYRADRGKLLKGTWYFEKFWLDSNDIKSLTSKRATKDKKYIKLLGDVKLHKIDDSIYRAQRVFYDMRGKRLFCKGAFRATKGDNWIDGKDFDYHINQKVTYAKSVFAHYVIGSLKSKKE